MQHDVFDSHFHIIDPRFPLIPNNGYLPEPFTTTDYRKLTRDLRVSGGVVVSGSFQGFDQEYLLHTLAELGPKFFRVAQLPFDVDDSQLVHLAAAGVRAVRFNLYRGGADGAAHLLSMARRVWNLAGMHVELYVDAVDLPDLEPILAQLPKVSVDHLGISEANRDCLLRLVGAGLRVKATGFGRIGLDVVAALQQIHEVDPKALMFGTDLPGTRAPRPFEKADITVISEALGTDALPAVLWGNAMQFYRAQ